MSEYPSGWTRTTFGNVLKHRKEVGHPDEELLAVTSSKGIVKRDSLERRDTSNEDKSKYLLVEKGDIAYNTMRMWQGVSGVSRFRGIVSPAYTICTPTEELDADFAGYLLKDPGVISIFRQRSQGLVSDTWNLKYEQFAQIPCALPPLPEQKKIAEILSGIDRCIQTKQSLINKADDTMRALKEDLMKGQEEWQELELGELLTFRNGLNTEKENFGQGVPFVSYKDVYAGGIVNSKMLKQRVSLSAVEEERFSLQSGDILFTRTSETPEEIGFTCVFDDKHGSAVFNGFCIRGRPLQEGKLIPEFASFYLRSEYVLIQMRLLCKYTTRAGISAESLSKVRVHIPDQETQKRLASSLLAVNRYRAAQVEAIENLKNIKKSVSEDLLSGRKRVPL